MEKQDLFTAGEDGFEIYRIPAIVTLDSGMTMVFAEARKHPREGQWGGDWADSQIVMRRSIDGGKTWGPKQIIAVNETGPTHNACPIADRNDPETLHLLYGRDYARVYYIRSQDSGKTWSLPTDITAAFKDIRKEYDWVVVAAGIGHSIMLDSGRLVVPTWFSIGTEDPGRHRPSRVAIVYSDDRGQTWHHGQLLPGALINPSESTAVQLSDGRLMLNIRSESSVHRRAVSISCDGGQTLSTPYFQPELWEPVCCAGFIKLPDSEGSGDTLLFTNPDSQAEYEQGIISPKKYPDNRYNLTARLSTDAGKTWPVKRLMEDGVSGYSDLSVWKDTILCAYEAANPIGELAYHHVIRVARFTRNWVENA